MYISIILISVGDEYKSYILFQGNPKDPTNITGWKNESDGIELMEAIFSVTEDVDSMVLPSIVHVKDTTDMLNRLFGGQQDSYSTSEYSCGKVLFRGIEIDRELGEKEWINGKRIMNA